MSNESQVDNRGPQKCFTVESEKAILVLSKMIFKMMIL